MDLRSNMDVPAGLKGVAVADTTIGSVRGGEGFFHYRQYDATELARQRSLEEIWYLLLEERLPTPVELNDFVGGLAEARRLPDGFGGVLDAIAARKPSFAGGLVAAIPLLAPFDPTVDIDAAARRRDAVAVAAAAPTVLAGLHRRMIGLEPVEPDPELSHAANWLLMLSGEVPTPAQERAVETYLAATIDHGFNNSTFTARTITSSGADVGGAMAGAVAALSGPLHGGAPGRVFTMLDEIGDPANTDDWVQRRLDGGEVIMGFGHAVYRADDPRSLLLREAAESFGGPLVERAILIEARILELLRAHKPEATIVTNVEYYASLVLHLAGLTPELFTPTFTVSRVIGWTAHILEQAANNKIIRPAANYVGPAAPAPVPAN